MFFEDPLVAVILHFGTEWTRAAFFEQLFFTVFHSADLTQADVVAYGK